MIKKINLGIDEAGRGCVLGPLYIAVAGTGDESVISFFKEKGITDSKKVEKEKRNEFRDIISKFAYFSVKKIMPSELDSFNINDLEFNYTIDLINESIKKFVSSSIDDLIFDVYIDCPISDEEKYSDQISNALFSHHSRFNIIAKNKADENYTIVGASSIMAKTDRDSNLAEIQNKYREEFGDIGSGYPSDGKTVSFLENFYKKNKNFPLEARKKWGTIERIGRKLNAGN